jgi:peptidoglycan/LPS O-acetylase OafA/YrhL
MVLVTHVGFSSGAGVSGTWAGWLSRLDFGVALFFLLSGFLLFRPYVQAAYGLRPPVKLGSYLRRRYVRLYPAFIITLLGVYFLLPASREKPTSLWVQTFFMVQNYFTAFGQQLDGLVQTWSLVIEVSFYVTLPLLALLILGRGSRLATIGTSQAVEAQPTTRRAAREQAARQRRSASRRKLTTPFRLPPHLQQHRPLIVLVGLFVGSLTWRLVYMITSEGYGRELLWLPAFIDWFVAGMALAWLRERPVPVPQALRYLASAPGVCACMALAGYWLATMRELGGPYDLIGASTGQGVFKHFSYAVIATMLLVPAVFGDPTANWRRHAVSPVMRWLGQISFGVFLWHPLLMELIREALNYPVFGGGFWVTLILTTVASVVVATLSWRFVEEPAQRRFRNGFRRSAVRAPREKSALARMGLKLPRRRRATAVATAGE